MPGLHVALMQLASGPDLAANREALGAVADVVAESPRPDLVVFPEWFMQRLGGPRSGTSPCAEPLDGPFVQRLGELARAHDVTMVAGMFETSSDPERPFNTLVVVDRDGLRATYRKIHLYDSFGYRESERLSAGPVEPAVVEVGGLTVGLMTCYDLRFPELARAVTDRGAELLLVPAAWVAGPLKVHHWRTLAAARAIENTLYVAAAGQPGPHYAGHSLVVAPTGEVLVEAGEGPEVVRAYVDRDVLAETRATNPSLANRRM